MIDIVASGKWSCKDLSFTDREVDKNFEHDHAKRFHVDSYHQLQTENYDRVFWGRGMQHKTQISKHYFNKKTKKSPNTNHPLCMKSTNRTDPKCQQKEQGKTDK